MKILVVGGGGREHAILRALARSSRNLSLFCAPGNAGTATEAENVDMQAGDTASLLAYAVREAIDLTVVGPEAPLVAGIVNAFSARGLTAFGPSRAAALLEGSKRFAKEVMAQAGVPSASSEIARSVAEARAVLDAGSFPVVLKADGLAAGKGVVIAHDMPEAEQALEEFFVDRRFGVAGDIVLVEEFLEGEELSLLAFCDGENALPLAPARDYKRIFDGDHGPNTGGMGSFSPVPGIDPDRAEEIADLVHRPVVAELARRGTPFHGVMYAGLMMTAEGPKVLEFNCRFGDPETEAILPRLESDLVDLFERSTVSGGLSGVDVAWSDRSSVTVILAGREYPAKASHGETIRGLAAAEQIEGVEIVHAGTAVVDGRLVTAGGRVLAVTGLGEDISRARQRAYEAANLIDFEGKQMRLDIAALADPGRVESRQARR